VAVVVRWQLWLLCNIFVVKGFYPTVERMGVVDTIQNLIKGIKLKTEASLGVVMDSSTIIQLNNLTFCLVSLQKGVKLSAEHRFAQQVVAKEAGYVTVGLAVQVTDASLRQMVSSPLRDDIQIQVRDLIHFRKCFVVLE
jgi:hypothetical protein